MNSKEKYLEKRNDLAKIVFSFIWSYKNGDNVLYNFDILNILYKSQVSSDVGYRQCFNKPITLIISAIIECILSDFIHRIKGHRREKIPNLSIKQIADFRYKVKDSGLVERQYKEFNHFIQAIEKNKIFGDDKIIYKALDFLRKVRNRIHIQNNTANDLPLDENLVFTSSNLKLAENLLNIIMDKMLNNYYRPGREDTSSINTKIFPW